MATQEIIVTCEGEEQRYLYCDRCAFALRRTVAWPRGTKWSTKKLVERH